MGDRFRKAVAIGASLVFGGSEVRAQQQQEAKKAGPLKAGEKKPEIKTNQEIAELLREINRF